MKEVIGGPAAPAAAGRSRSRSRSRSPSSKSSRSSSASSSSSSSRRKKKKKKKGKQADRDVSSSPEVTVTGVEAANKLIQKGASDGDSKEVQEAKLGALQKLTGLQSVEPKDRRMKEWRALLRQWHPDKNPDRLEVATAVFQFLQKGKKLLAL